MRIISAWLLMLFLVFLTPRPIDASNDLNLEMPTGAEVSEAISKTVPIRFLPNHPLYILILIKEKVTRFAKHSSAKRAQFDLAISGKRLKESYLLFESGKINNAGMGMRSYAKSLDAMSSEIEKARSQNQDIAALVGEAAGVLRLEESLLAAMYNQWKIKQVDVQFGNDFYAAFSSYSKAITILDGIQPGIKNRFKSITIGNVTPDKETAASPLPTATISASPKRIVY